ncbi:MAG: hypothetical protein ABS79_06805 [Planctomycetes bacterium SCN 63-9]|nr:MAG: hypothetical protein ABS79_06805 [Planctomycetes bacterium SCN 63-9]
MSQRGIPDFDRLGPCPPTLVLFFIFLAVAFATGDIGHADTVTMKNGVIYKSQGAPERDNTLVYLWDGLKRIVVRDSKIDHITADNSFRTDETFKLDQPIVVHAGQMPKEVVSVQATEWNEKGRRSFRYMGPKLGKVTAMEQAIIEMTPHRVRYRGIDGFWMGHLSTSVVPREVITGLLGRVEQENQAERERVVRFEIAAGWYREAKESLDGLLRDFPDSELKARAESARTLIIQAEASQRRAELDIRRKAQQYRKAEELLTSLAGSDKDLSTEFASEIRELSRKAEENRRNDQATAGEIPRLAVGLPEASRDFWKQPIQEVARALKAAPDAVRGRLEAYQRTVADPRIKPLERFALAMSGYVAGIDGATTNLNDAETLWKARDLLQEYLRSRDPGVDADRIENLNTLVFPGAPDQPEIVRQLNGLTQIIGNMLPPFHKEPKPEKDPGQPAREDRTALQRVSNDDNPVPTEYLVRLPPEYNPLYRYPTIVALHDGRGPRSAVDWWTAEADRRGYIIIAPQYNIPGQPPDYRYTTSEHASVELALRDARQRFSIDSDRVFLGGSLIGGNMAWDYGLAHPDLFAGIVVISGLPAKYVPRYLDQHEHLPLYYVTGNLAPASTELIFGRVLKPRILKAWDITYVEYGNRGLEDFPEEAVPIFDWIDKHRREPYLRAFTAVTARESDNRFYGVVVREFARGRATAPEAVEMLGQNLNPATFKFTASTGGNLCRIDNTSGVKRLDIWLSPRQFDFSRKVSVRINGKPIRGQDDLNLSHLLEDLKLRGDRQQLYWHKITVD